MRSRRVVSPLLVSVLVAIGCGSGKPQDAAATPDTSPTPEVPMQVAQAPAGGEQSPGQAPAGGERSSGQAIAAVQSAAASGGSASIRGSVRFDGTAPERKKVNRLMEGTDVECRHSDPVYLEGEFIDTSGTVYSQGVVVNGNGTLKNVFVYVKEGLSGTFPTPSQPVVIDQAGCLYSPHVFGIQVNQPLDIVNSDPTDHNVNALSTTKRTLFNLSQPRSGVKKMTKQFAKAEIMVKFKCNVHPWMNAYAGVLEHPFYSVSGDDGAFAITGLPAGTYTIEAWHEKYGAQTQSVTVGDGESKSVELTFKAQ